MIPGYALVTPARDERANLERLAESVSAQTLPPAAWVIVDDGSEDGTTELVEALAGRHDWVRPVGTGCSGAPLADGRRTGRALDAFRRGVRELAEPVEVVAKVDADTSFDADYFEQIVARFRAHPDLGIAGGACYELEADGWRRQRTIATHPRGASRAYRWECLDAVMSLDSRMGWDGLDEIKAELRGYRSEAFLDLGFRHHRSTGERERSRFGHYLAQGRAAWYMGYRPTYLLLRAAYRGLRDPSALAMACGYLTAASRRDARCRETDVVHALRRQQRLGTVLRRGTPP